MKLILVNEDKGGDHQVHIFTMGNLTLEEDRPEMGFHTNKEIELRLIGEVRKATIHKLSRKRNVMKHLAKLFRRKKRGNTNT
jgi:hypothetical protein